MPPLERLTCRDAIRARLERDRVWSGFALGDLESPMFEKCEWYAAGEATALVYLGFDPPILFLAGPGAEVSPLLAALPCPPRVYFNAQDDHLPGLERRLEITHPYRVRRMVLDRAAWDDLAPAEPCGVARAGPEHLDAVSALFVHGGGTFFSPAQLQTGYFVGVWESGCLVSIAGVHLATRSESVAAVGNVFTHPEWRSRGLGQACTRAVTEALVRDGFRTIILNVESGNTTAVRIYERLGYRTHCEYTEGPAVLRAP